MKCVRKLLFATPLLLGLVSMVPANAATWNFSYRDKAINPIVFGSGTFETGALSEEAEPYATITGITGTANGATIERLSGYASANNRLYMPGLSEMNGFHADIEGISFHTTADIDWNLAGFEGGSAMRSDTNSNGNIDTWTSITMQVTAVPEPESYAMLLAGLGVMGAIARRRKSRTA